MQRSLVLGLILLILALAACKQTTLPADPGLATEDFGIGIMLDQPVTDAEQAAAGAPAEIKAECLSPEELNAKSPYVERPEGRDLVFALHAPLQYTSDGSAADRVFEIRCYLGPVDKSTLTLLGHQLASLDPNGMQQLLGTPVSVGEGGDGHTHLTFIYRVEDVSAPAVEVTSSHWLGGQCFAFRIALTDSPE